MKTEAEIKEKMQDKIKELIKNKQEIDKNETLGFLLALEWVLEDKE